MEESERMESASLSEAESVELEHPQGRKRLRHEPNWARNKQKRRKDRGKAYATYHGKGESVGKKKLIPVACKCQFNCTARVNVEERIRIFKDFYKLSSHDEQNKYLFGLIRRSSPTKKRSKANPRNNTFIYSVRLSTGNSVQVCKKIFQTVHAITKRRVENICEKLVSGVLFSGDSRGKHDNRPNRINESLKDQIREHIRSYPSQESHYSRSSNRKRKYLSEGLSIARMYRQYLEMYEPNISDGEAPQVKEYLYRKIFTEEFNIGFGYPRSDTCEKCDLLKLSINIAQSENERDQKQAELAEHQEKASQGYRSLRTDSALAKDDPETLVIAFDLEQNLPVPTLTHNSMFYLRQLWVYNFGIHLCSDESAFMCIWDETIAGRGSSEIISCLLEYLSCNNPSVKKLTCYSDSCFGQNKNTQMICFWEWLIWCQRFTRIDHKFLVRGHTYLPCDRDFALIEKRKPSAMVHLPGDWEKVIKEARPSKPFDIQRMSKDNFFDFSVLSANFTMRKKCLSKQTVLISTGMWFNFGEGEDGGKIIAHPGEYWMKTTFSTQDPWQKVCILKGRSKQPPSTDINLPVLYDDGHPIKSSKIADLQKMVPFLPPACRDFYTSLADNPILEESDEETDDNGDQE